MVNEFSKSNTTSSSKTTTVVSKDKDEDEKKSTATATTSTTAVSKELSQAINDKLADATTRRGFVSDVVDIVAQFANSKLSTQETADLEELIEFEFLQKTLKVKKA